MRLQETAGRDSFLEHPAHRCLAAAELGRFGEGGAMRMVAGGVEYLDEDAELFPDGSVHDATLARDTLIQGVPCAGGRSVVYFPGGRLRLAWLSRPATIGAVACAPGIVYLHENGGLLNATLAAPHEFAGVTVPAGERVTLGEQGWLLEHSRRLSADQPVGGLPCSAEFHVWVYPGGRPSVVVLAAASPIGGREYPRGAELFLDEDGQVLDSRVVDLYSGRRYQQRVFGVYETPFE
jgi:hypothetical protein